MIRWIAGLLLLVGLAAAAAYIVAGRSTPPRLTIDKPDRAIGQSGSVDVTAEAPNGKFTALTLALEQNGKRVPLYALEAAPGSGSVTPLARTHERIAHPPRQQ